MGGWFVGNKYIQGEMGEIAPALPQQTPIHILSTGRMGRGGKGTQETSADIPLPLIYKWKSLYYFILEHIILFYIITNNRIL